MRIRKFKAATMGEALQAVKTGLGDSAVILKTRTMTVAEDGRRGFEVTAAQDLEPIRASRTPASQPVQVPPVLGAIPAAGLVQTLVSRGVDELLARRLTDAWQKKSRPADSESLEKALAALIPSRNDLKLGSKPYVIALVGPTGAGKTTTLAKLAAQFVLDRRLSVQLVTADTHRIAAVEQLEAYARLLGTDFQVGYAPDEIRSHREASQAQVVLLDTPGVGPMDDAGMGYLGDILRAASPNETHLVLSAAVRTQDLKLCAVRFQELGCDRLIFTKMDETATAGQILSALAETRLPVSYWTCGQIVPGDIQAATGEGLARLILGGLPHAETVRAIQSA